MGDGTILIRIQPTFWLKSIVIIPVQPESVMTSVSDIVLDQELSKPSVVLCFSLGCMKDVRFNNYGLPLDSYPKEMVLSAQGVKKGCLSDACRSNPCSPQFICIDLWMIHECR